MRNLVVTAGGVALSLWIGVGRWIFGVGGELTWWYAPLMGIPYLLLHLWLVRRFNIAVGRGRPIGRAPYVALALSWVSAIGFGLTVPDLVEGHLQSVLTRLAGDDWLEMSIALCNPFGIAAFALLIIALGYAAAAGRIPRPEEDEADGQMVPHPLQSAP